MVKEMNISLDTLKKIVKIAKLELGHNVGLDGGTVCLRQDGDKSCWSTKENFYKGSLSHHSLDVQSDIYYNHRTEYSQLIDDKKRTI